MRHNTKFKKKIQIYIAFSLIIALNLQATSCFAVPSARATEITRNVISNPTNETVSLFIKTMMKEYKRAYKACEYDEAADYLRSALYFLVQNTNTEEYNNTYQKLNSILEKTGTDTTQVSRLEIAKNLYLEGKYFASAYEFLTLLKENYEVDLCYEYLGDIARKLNNEEAGFAFYKKAVEINPENINVKYKYANFLLKKGMIDDANYYMEDVIEHTNQEGVINEIISIYTKRVSDDPDNEINYGVLGLAYQKLGQYGKTYQLLKKSLMLNPNDIFLQYYLANLLFNIKEYAFADEIYTEILEENPYESQIRISRAKTYTMLNDKEKAIKDYQIVLAMYPDSMQAQYGLYSLLKDKISLDKIINLFYPLEPDYKLTYEGYENLGYFANKMGNSKDAKVFFEKALQMNPKSEINYIELYKIYQLFGMNDKAKAIIQSAYKMFPNNQEIIGIYKSTSSDKNDEKNSVALSYLNEGEYQKAITVYEQIEPKTAETNLAIANCYRQLGDLKNAVSYYKKSIQMNPDNSDTYYALGVAYLEANNLDKAKETFIKSVEKDPKNLKSKKMISFLEQKEVGQSLDLAYEAYEKKDYNLALRYLNKGIEAFPNDAKIYYYRGLTKEALGDIKGASSDFRTTTTLDRNFVEAYFKLAETLDRLNKRKEALFMYEKYLGAEKLDPDMAKRAEQRVIELGEKYY